MGIWYWALMVLLALAAVQSALFTLQTFEHRRFVRSRVLHPRVGPSGRVAVFAPCKGLDTQMLDNLRPLFEQDHGDYELIFVVDSSQDPACEPIRQLMSEHRKVRAQLVVAGAASHSGQKVHNLLAATARLRPEVRYLAFVDSDARPHRQWLRLLVQQLGTGQAGAATGYRCFLPCRATLPNLVLYSLESVVATLVGPCVHQMVWGGTWAVRRDVFEELGIRQAWLGTLSDDLVASRLLADSSHRAVFEPACMVASPVDVDWSTMLSFIRRQYFIGRFYAHKWWVAGLGLVLLSQAGFWGSLAGFVTLVSRGAAGGWVCGAVLALLFALHMVRAWLRQDAVRIYLPQHRRRLTWARRFDICLGPAAGLINLLAILSTLVGQHIVWRGIRYRLSPSGQVQVLTPPRTRPVRQPSVEVAVFRKAG